MTSHRGRAAADGAQAALARLIDASADGIWILASNGGIDCMNSAARRLFGTTGPSKSWTAGWPEASLRSGRCRPLWTDDGQALTVHDLRSTQIVLANRSAEALSADLPARDYDAAAAGPGRITRTDILETAAGPRCSSTLEIATYDDSGARHLISLSQDVTAEQADREAAHLAVRAAEEAQRRPSRLRNDRYATPRLLVRRARRHMNP